MRVLVTGASGLVGSALVPFLAAKGHQVTRLVRGGHSGPGTVRWDPVAGTIDREALRGVEAAVHLAGESIIGRWTGTKKAAIRESRVEGTRRLCEALLALSPPPSTLVCASAVGFYGERGAELLHEDSSPGFGFLTGVCREWEGATDRAAERGMRVVNLRIGLVLSRQGGALAKMLLPFQLGMGGAVGSGQQYWSWIAIDDLLGAIHHALTLPALRGPVNAVTPTPVTNREFTRTLGRVLWRPTVVPVPAFAVRLLMGEMGRELLLASTRVEPRRLLATGYQFQFPELEGALRHVLHPD
jgi:uncharacterized protein (TIGR01777 family)